MEETKDVSATVPAQGPMEAQGTFIHAHVEEMFPNPYQPRKDSRVSVRPLADSFRTSGMLQIVTARRSPDGKGYQIINGHRRVEALRLLVEEAQTEEERRRFSTVLIHLRENVSDEQMALEGLVENLHRVDLDVVEQAAGLENYRAMAGLKNSAELAGKVGMEPRRVRRLLQLHKGPDFIKNACTTGLLVPVARAGGSGEEGQPERREHRRLELLAAIAFIRLHEHYEETSTPAYAQKRVEPMVKKALEEGWPLSRIEAHCQRLIEGGKKAGGDEVEGQASAEAAPGVAETSTPEEARGSLEAGAGASPVETRDDVAEEQSRSSSDETASLREMSITGGPPPNPALEYVRGDPNEILIHLNHAEELSPEQRKQMRQMCELLVQVFTDP